MACFHHNAENNVHSHNITQITEKQYYNRQRYKGFQTDGLFKAFFISADASAMISASFTAAKPIAVTN